MKSTKELKIGDILQKVSKDTSSYFNKVVKVKVEKIHADDGLQVSVLEYEPGVRKKNKLTTAFMSTSLANFELTNKTNLYEIY